MTEKIDQVCAWRALCSRLGIEVISPCEVAFSDGDKLSATALVMVGPEKGMVVDPSWSTLEPFADRLVVDGFGVSCVAIGGANDFHACVDMLRDWGWNGPVR